MYPNTGHRAFTGDLGDNFVSQRGSPGPPRQTYLMHLCSDAGHQGLHRGFRAHTNIVTPARGFLTEYLEDKAPPQRGQLNLSWET